jgi:hypothetical protein
MKRFHRCIVFSWLAIGLAVPLVGCQEDNEAGVRLDVEGKGDPKYAKDDQETYRAFAKDHIMKSEPKGKSGKAAPTKQ